MEIHGCEVLLVCSVQVTPESVDVYMEPAKATAASFCMRMIGWERQVSAAAMVLHALSPSCPQYAWPTDRLRPSTCVERGGYTHASIVTPTPGIAAAPVVGDAGARYVPYRRPRTQWNTNPC